MYIFPSRSWLRGCPVTSYPESDAGADCERMTFPLQENRRVRLAAGVHHRRRNTRGIYSTCQLPADGTAITASRTCRQSVGSDHQRSHPAPAIELATSRTSPVSVTCGSTWKMSPCCYLSRQTWCTGRRCTARLGRPWNYSVAAERLNAGAD